MRGSGAFRTSVAPGGVLAGPWVSNPLWRNARAVPSLDLDFANNKSLIDRVTSQNLVSFTRASSATFVDSSGVLRSAVMNLLLRSEEFDTTWTRTAVLAFGSGSITDAIAAPNGTVTADRITEDTANTQHFVAQNVNIPSNTAITASIYVKFDSANRRAFLQINDGTNYAGVILAQDGSVVAQDTNFTNRSFSAEAVGSGWYRLRMSLTTATATNITVRIILISGTNSQSYLGDGTSGIYLWGAQLEQASTVGDYVPTTSAINSAPRFDHNPTTGESLGLLVEEARTNLLLQSNAFTTTWSNTDAVATATQTTAPDGTTAGWKLATGTGNTNHNIFQSIAFTAVATTVSVFVKYLDHRWVGIRMGVVGNQFFGSWDLQNSVVGSVTAGATIGMQAVGNGWYRLTLTATLTAAGSANCIIALNNADAIALTNYTGTGTGIYIYGAQLEAGAFPTSYIPTTSATVTRAADAASITGSAFSGWYRQDEGTVYSETNWAFTHTATVPTGLSSTWEINNTATSNNNYCILGNNATTIDQSQGRNPTIGFNRPSISGFGFKQAGVLYKTAFGWNPSVLQHSTNTLLSNAPANTVAALMATHDRMLIGQATGGAPPYQLNGTIKRLTYWPTRLSNTTLQQITQP